jgi:hypothetical protein
MTGRSEKRFLTSPSSASPSIPGRLMSERIRGLIETGTDLAGSGGTHRRSARYLSESFTARRAIPGPQFCLTAWYNVIPGRSWICLGGNPVSESFTARRAISGPQFCLTAWYNVIPAPCWNCLSGNPVSESFTVTVLRRRARPPELLFPRRSAIGTVRALTVRALTVFSV